jgi:hypothetical protein
MAIVTKSYLKGNVVSCNCAVELAALRREFRLFVEMQTALNLEDSESLLTLQKNNEELVKMGILQEPPVTPPDDGTNA